MVVVGGGRGRFASGSGCGVCKAYVVQHGMFLRIEFFPVGVERVSDGDEKSVYGSVVCVRCGLDHEVCVQ